MISDELEKTLQRTQKFAKSFKHQYMTLEHLLFSMLDDNDVIKVLDACVIDKDKLKKNLEKFVEGNLRDLVNESSENEVKPTLGFQRVIQRAVIHVQSSGKEEANAANVLVAIFSERESHAVYFLQQENLNRLDVVNYLSHGIEKENESDDFDQVLNDYSEDNQQKKSMTFLRRSSKSPLNFVPANRAPRSREKIFESNSELGTSFFIIFKAKPSASAVLPTPGSPTNIGLFLFLLARTWIVLLISFSLPMIGSILPDAAFLFKSTQNFSIISFDFFCWLSSE